NGVETPEILYRAFYFGDKARHFAVDIFDDGRNFLTGINDCSDDTISFIYDRIRNVLEVPKVVSQTRENTSSEFRRFFHSQNNRREFLRKINNLPTPEAKLQARDYYLYFLHVAGTAG